MNMILTLVIPCYNESKNLPVLIERCKTVFKDKPVEVILVDNGSTDNSQEILKRLLLNQEQVRTVRVEKNQGYGYGILQGLNAATTPFIGWTHADMQTDPHDLLQALDLIASTENSENIFIKGKRYGRPLGDRIFTFGMSVFETLLLRTVLYDINAQPTVFYQNFYKKWQNPPHDFSLDLYAYYQAKTHRLIIKKFSVKFGERLHGVSHWNINWQAKIKFIKRTMTYSLALYKELKHGNN